MAQTPQQRRANEKFAKDQNARRGKSEAERQVRTKQVQKAPISPLWLVLLGFVVFGGVFFEVLQRVFWR